MKFRCSRCQDVVDGSQASADGVVLCSGCGARYRRRAEPLAVSAPADAPATAPEEEHSAALLLLKAAPLDSRNDVALPIIATPLEETPSSRLSTVELEDRLRAQHDELAARFDPEPPTRTARGLPANDARGDHHEDDDALASRESLADREFEPTTEAAPPEEPVEPSADSLFLVTDSDPEAGGTEFPDSAHEEPLPIQEEQPRQGWTRRIVAGVLTLALALLGWTLWKSSPSSSENTETPRLAIDFGQPRPTVGVFDLTSSNHRDGWFAAVAAEEIRRRLAGPMRVVSTRESGRVLRAAAIADPADALLPATLERLASGVGADSVVLVSGGGDASRLEMTIYDRESRQVRASPETAGDTVDQLWQRLVEALPEMATRTVPEKGEAFEWLPSEAIEPYGEALAHARFRKPDQAIEALERAALADENSVPINLALGQALEERGSRAEALEHYRTAHEFAGTVAPHQRRRIDYLHQRLLGRWQKAAEVAEQVWRETPDDIEWALWYVEALREAGQLDQARATLHSLMDFAGEESCDPRLALAAFEVEADLHRWDRAMESALTAREDASLRGVSSTVALADLALARGALGLGEANEAERHLENAARVFEELGDSWQLMALKLQRARVAAVRGRLENAATTAAETAASAGRESRFDLQLEGLLLAGELEARNGSTKEASRTFARVISLSRPLAQTAAEAAANDQLAVLQLRLGQPDLAVENFKLAARSFREMGNRRSLSRSLSGLTRTYAARGEWKDAVGVYQDALALAHESELRWLTAEVYAVGAQVALARAQLDEAQSMIEEGLSLVHELQLEPAAGDLHLAAGLVALTRDQSAEAEAAFGRALTIYRAHNLGIEHEAAALGLARSVHQVGDLARAQQLLLEITGDLDRPVASKTAVLATAWLAEVWADQERPQQATRAAVAAEKRARDRQDLETIVAAVLARARAALVTGDRDLAATAIRFAQEEGGQRLSHEQRLRLAILNAHLEALDGRTESAREGLLALSQEAAEEGFFHLAARARRESENLGTIVAGS